MTHSLRQFSFTSAFLLTERYGICLKMCTWQRRSGRVDLYKNRLTLLFLLHSVDADVVKKTGLKVNQVH